MLKCIQNSQITRPNPVCRSGSDIISKSVRRIGRITNSAFNKDYGLQNVA